MKQIQLVVRFPMNVFVIWLVSSKTTLCANRWCSLFRQFGISCKPFAQVLGALGSFGATFQKEYEYVHSSPEGGELRIVCRSVSIVNEC